ncbi:MAG: hypothetical protein HC871_15685, partial [Rhizobiales bacterium]|nr:hypothetical protein [Hyphomicrobiales bacterium]
MPRQLVKTALGLALGFLLIDPALAVPLIPPTTVTGVFSTDDESQQFEFVISAESIVTIETISYAGGTFASNPALIAGPGGFDPILSLFDGTGAFIAANDDGLGVAVDPGTGFAFDSRLETTLAPGVYTVVVTQFDNFFAGGVGDDISTGFVLDGDPTFTSFFGCSEGIFCDLGGNDRSFPARRRAQELLRRQHRLPSRARALDPGPGRLWLVGLITWVGVGVAARLPSPCIRAHTVWLNSARLHAVPHHAVPLHAASRRLTPPILPLPPERTARTCLFLLDYLDGGNCHAALRAPGAHLLKT